MTGILGFEPGSSFVEFTQLNLKQNKQTKSKTKSKAELLNPQSVTPRGAHCLSGVSLYASVLRSDSRLWVVACLTPGPKSGYFDKIWKWICAGNFGKPRQGFTKVRMLFWFFSIDYYCEIVFCCFLTEVWGVYLSALFFSRLHSSVLEDGSCLLLCVIHQRRLLWCGFRPRESLS